MTYDPYGRNLDNAALWQEARGLADLGELTARWLDGGIAYHPGNLGPGPDPETMALVPVLVRANRAGFVTDFSQPGEIEDGWSQRACVSGFCDEVLADRVEGGILGTDLVAQIWLPGTSDESLRMIPVTIDHGEAHTWAGGALDPEISRVFGDEVPADALVALRGAYQMTLFDPRWGRNDLLWNVLDTITAAP
ncbi:MAG: DUF6919 domain-containing protein [Microthrixaceae bacterium]